MLHKTSILIPAMLCSLLAGAQENKQKSSYAVAFHPIQITEDNVGLGASFEYFLDKQKSVSLYLPVSYALPVVNNYRYYDPGAVQYIDLTYGPNREFYDLHDEWTDYKGMAYFYPGVKFYTGKKLSRASYCVGASLLAGVGQASFTSVDYAADTISSTQQAITYKRREIARNTTDIIRLKLGVMVTNSLNIRAGKHLYTGLEMGLGYTYLNNEGSAHMQRGMLAQLGMKIGYYK